MTILDIDETALAGIDVKIGTDFVAFTLADGSSVSAPVWWYPRLATASLEQQQNWEILPFGDAVAWHEIDEYISAKALLAGGPAPGARPQAEAAE
ncbi:MAG: DUF2442 domain-containing protein [Pseudomonadota bacterium]